MVGFDERAWATSPPLLCACLALLSALISASAAQGCAKPPASSVVVNVKNTGAKGDGSTDDTAAIQRAIDAVAGKGGTVLAPDGRYMVDAVTGKRLKLKGKMTLKLSAATTLKVIANGATKYSVLTIADASDVTVVGGTLEGERYEHQGKTGEYGMGIRIGPGAAHITVSGLTSKNMWGDGFFVEGATSVTFCSVVADHNRRQGLSVTEADGLVVTNSVFSNTSGTGPSAGIDLEPWKDSQKISNVRIVASKFLHNAGGGILVLGKKGTNNISSVEITGNLFRGVEPIKVKYSPGVHDDAICDNRHIVPRIEAVSSLPTFTAPPEEIVLRSNCGDLRIQKRR